MKILLEGLRKFQSNISPEQQALFQKLSQGQSPHTLMITCSDSRIDPNLVTQTQPGEIFVVRNAGNIVPPYGSSNGGEEATIEFAIDGLKVKHIVVCGHTSCGAMSALLKLDQIPGLPALKRWLTHAEATRRRCGDDLQTERAVQENVKVQIQNLKTHPAVSAALREGRVDIFGWIYHLDTGFVSLYDPNKDRFIPSVELGGSVDLRAFAT